jgi:hypothetical protein
MICCIYQLSIENNYFIPYEVKFIKMYIKDREKSRRTSHQELEVKVFTKRAMNKLK